MPVRFSARWEDGDPGPNALTEAVARRRAAELPLLDLTVSNPTAVGLEAPSDWPRLLADAAVRSYAPDPRGLRGARAAISAYYAGRGASADPEDLFLAAGTSEGYAHLFRLLCDAGDAVLVPAPSYPLLEALAGFADVRLDPYPLAPRPGEKFFAWELDRSALEAALTPETKAVCVVQPNNPTGSVLSADDTAWLLDFASRNGLAILVDEVFADYRFDGGSAALLESEGPLVFTLNGLSKLVGLPQLKLAWIHVGGNARNSARAKAHLEWMCDAFLSVGTAPQLACPELLRRRAEFQGPIRARLAENLATLREIAAAHPRLEPLWPQGGWCAPVRCAGIGDDEAFAIRLVEEAGALVQPGYFFDFADEETIVLSLLTPPAEFREGLGKIAAALT